MKRRIIYEKTNDGKVIDKILRDWKRLDNMIEEIRVRLGSGLDTGWTCDKGLFCARCRFGINLLTRKVRFGQTVGTLGMKSSKPDPCNTKSSFGHGYVYHTPYSTPNFLSNSPLFAPNRPFLQVSLTVSLLRNRLKRMEDGATYFGA